MTQFIRLLFVSLLICHLPASAQLPNSLPRNALKSIRDKARVAIEHYETLLNIAANADQEYSEEGLKSKIDEYFTRGTHNFLFFDSEKEVAPDWRWNKNERKDVEKLKSFLTSYSTFYKGNKESPITIVIKDYTRVCLAYANNAYFIRVSFTQKMNGTNEEGVPYPAELKRYADLRVEPVNKEFLVLINDIGYLDEATPVNCTPVSESDAYNFASEENYSQAYYDQQYEGGRRDLANKDYGNAFVALNEATKGSEVTAQKARKEINELSNQIRLQGKDQERYLFNLLMLEADRLREKFNFSRSRKYLEYAYKLRPSDPSTGKAKERVANAERKILELEELLNNKAYESAITAYFDALRKDPHNPHLLVGLGRAYMYTGIFTNAAAKFDDAKRSEPTFTDIYRHLAELYSQQHDYAKALDELLAYQKYTDDPGQPWLLSDIAYYKGLTLADSNPDVALDSFDRAIGYMPDNIFPHLAKAVTLGRKGNERKAFEILKPMLRKDAPAEALIASGKIYRMVAERAGINETKPWEDAISDLSAAAAIKQDIDLFYELATLYIEKPDPDPGKSRFWANKCVTASVNASLIGEKKRLVMLQQKAVLLIARANYYEARDNEADQSFREYRSKAGKLPLPEYYIRHALLLIRRIDYPGAGALLDSARTEGSLKYFAKSLLFYSRDRANYESLFTEALMNGLPLAEIKSAGNIVGEMAKNNKKVRQMLKDRGIKP